VTSILINGAPDEVADGTTVADLVEAHRPSPRGLAVARNEEVVPRSQWAATVVADGDRVEILSAAQGG
jgi:sulfur carrier protein